LDGGRWGRIPHFVSFYDLTQRCKDRKETQRESKEKVRERMQLKISAFSRSREIIASNSTGNLVRVKDSRQIA